VREKYGRIDVLYVNAGIAKLVSVAETTEEIFDEILDANFRAAYFTVQKALPLLSDGGAIVFTTSWFDEAGVAGTSAAFEADTSSRSAGRCFAWSTSTALMYVDSGPPAAQASNTRSKGPDGRICTRFSRFVTEGLAFFPVAGECWRTGVTPQRTTIGGSDGYQMDRQTKG
jgi:hypothetical protein